MNWTSTNNALISAGNISYYDKIADRYEAILKKDDKNEVVRNRVAKSFVASVKYGTVLDFGGGTGLDFSWLLEHHYDIIFCEPSASMRGRAKERRDDEFPGSHILFLDEDKTDFRKWEGEFPFQQRVNAVLANFAVFNCIPDIHLLFDKLALSVETGGAVVALILDSRLKKRLRSNFKGTVMSFFSRKPVELMVEEKKERQLVYLHSIRAIRRAAMDGFHFIHHERLTGLGFSLIHLVKK